MSFHLKIDGSVEQSAELECRFELFQHPFHQVFVVQHRIIDVLDKQPVALFEKVGMWMVLRISVRYTNRIVLGIEREIARLCNGIDKRLAVEKQRIAKAFQQNPIGHIHTRANQTAFQIIIVSGLQMEIIATQQRGFSIRTYERAKMGLVGSLVGRKTQIAVKAVGAILHCQALTRVIELRDAENQMLGKFAEQLVGFLIMFLMREKSFTIVVAGDSFQKCQYFFHNKRIEEQS